MDWSARRVTYGRWFGQRKLDHDGRRAAYPFGFGPGCTRFELGGLRVGAAEGDRFDVEVEVANTRDRAGRHVVQVYACLTGADGGPVVLEVGAHAGDPHALTHPFRPA